MDSISIISDIATFASSRSPWMLNSRALSHMINNKALFSSLSLDTSLSSVSITDSSLIPVLGIGIVCVTSTITLFNVLYIPKFPVNLLSISTLTRTLNCSNTFLSSHYVFQDLKTKATIGGGSRFGGVYVLTDSASSAHLSTNASTY